MLHTSVFKHLPESIILKENDRARVSVVTGVTHLVFITTIEKGQIVRIRHSRFAAAMNLEHTTAR